MEAGSHLLRIGIVAQLVFVSVLTVANIASEPVTSQSSSCDVPPSSDWAITEDPGDYLSVGSPDNLLNLNSGDGAIFYDGGSGLRPLDKGLSTEWSDGAWSGFQGIQVKNKSATSIMMVLEPGKKYTFCIDFSSKGDIYLLTASNYDMYQIDYMCEENDWNPICDPEEMERIPMEWRDLATWITFRDSHAYESVSYEEFSVAIDSSGTAWSFAGFGSSSEQVFYLVLDGWNNSRPSDELPSGDMSVEVIVDVQDRQTLPKITAYILVGALPLSCIIIPMIVHWKYHSSALGEGEGGIVEVPYLKDG
tara:strand:- start:135 stop:1052 length:918 start_codon:yes stop_codon:yes gene_type:complete